MPTMSRKELIFTTLFLNIHRHHSSILEIMNQVARVRASGSLVAGVSPKAKSAPIFSIRRSSQGHIGLYKAKKVAFTTVQVRWLHI